MALENKEFNRTLIDSLFGNLIPIGGSNSDELKLSKIKDLIDLLDYGSEKLMDVYNHHNNGEMSMVMCSNQARDYFKNLESLIKENVV